MMNTRVYVLFLCNAFILSLFRINQNLIYNENIASAHILYGYLYV